MCSVCVYFLGVVLVVSLWCVWFVVLLSSVCFTVFGRVLVVCCVWLAVLICMSVFTFSILHLFTSTFASTKMFRPHADFIEGQEPYGPLQHLVEAEAGPQSQVGAEEVEGGHEVEGVHGDPGDGDLVREGDVDNIVVLIPLRDWPSHYGGGRPLAGNLAARCSHSSTNEVT